MANKKPLSSAQVHKHLQKRAKKEVTGEKKRAQHYGQGDKLMRQVSTTLKKIAATHPNPAGKKQANMALKQLNAAHTAFGNACMCQGGDVYGQDDT